MIVCNYPLAQLVNRPDIEENLGKTQILPFFVPRGCCISVIPAFGDITHSSSDSTTSPPSSTPPSKNLNTPSTLFSRICLCVSIHSWQRFDIRLHNHQVSLVSRRFGAFCHHGGCRRRRRPHRRVTPTAVEPRNTLVCV